MMGGMQTGTQKHEVLIVVSTLRPYPWPLKSITWMGGAHRDAELHTPSVQHQRREEGVEGYENPRPTASLRPG